MYGDPNQRKSLDFIYINYKKFGRYKIWDKIDDQIQWMPKKFICWK